MSTTRSHGATSPAIPAPHSNVEKITLSNTPALFAGICLAGGILFGQRLWTPPGVVLLAAILMAFVTVVANCRAPRLGWLSLACCWLILGLFLNEAQRGPDPQRRLASIADNGGLHSIEGDVIRTGPVRTAPSNSRYGRPRREEHSESFDLRIRTVDGVPITGGLRATMYSPVEDPFSGLRCGDAVRAKLAMHLPERFLDPGVWDSTQWLLTQGVGVVASAKASQLEILQGSRHSTFPCWLRSIQEAGTQRLREFADTGYAHSRLPPWLRLNAADAGMLGAMILGDRTYLDRSLRIGFERTGSFHLLVVSGMHLALFAGFIFALAALFRLPAAVSTAVTIASSLAYALVTGFGEPVQRSFWMVTLYLLARLLFRERNSLNAIGFAILCLLAWDPGAILQASFQMTLLSVLVAAGIVVPIAENTFAPYLRATRSLRLVALDAALPHPIAQFRVTLRLLSDHLRPWFGRRAAQDWFPSLLRLLLRLLELLLASAAIELAMALPMAVYFHRITLLALPVNVLVIPLIAIALPAALIAFAAVLIAPWLAVAPAAVAADLLHAILAIVHLFGGMPTGDMRTPAPGAVAVTAAVLLLLLSVWAARNSRFPVSLSLAALVCSAVCVFYPQRFAFHPGVLEVTAIDVGQGDSLLLVSPEGKTLLIDAGGPTGAAAQAPASNFDIGEDVVSPVLWTRNLRRLDAVALTHAHSDHMGGMPAILENFRPRELWVGNNPHDAAYDALLNQAARLGIRVRSWAAGDSFNFGGAQVRVLAPARDYQPGPTPSNNDSLVLHVACGRTSTLLEGDAEAASEVRMLPEDLASNLLKVGHHGSKTSTIPPFLAEVHPRYAIISVGHRNPYGHPKIDVLKRLQAAHVLTYRTDAIGATSFYLNGNGVRAQPIGAR